MGRFLVYFVMGSPLGAILFSVALWNDDPAVRRSSFALFCFVTVSSGLLVGLIDLVRCYTQERKRVEALERYLRSLKALGDIDEAVDAGLVRIARSIDGWRTQLTILRERGLVGLYGTTPANTSKDLLVEQAEQVGRNFKENLETAENQFYSRYDEHARFIRLTGVTLRRRDWKFYLEPSKSQEEPPASNAAT